MQNQYIAGIAIDNYGTITNTINKMNIGYQGSGGSDMSTRVAGIVINNYATVTQCGNEGILKGTLVAGVVNQNLGVLSKSYSKGNIVAVSNSASVQALAGGIAVRNTTVTLSGKTYTGSIEHCYAIISSLTFTMQRGSTYPGYVGGIVADTNVGTLTGCYVAITSVSAMSVTNGTAGIIVGVDNRGNASNYVGNYYSSALILNGLGSNENLNIAQSVNNNVDLTAVLFELYPSIYAYDSNSINNGYPVFAWQITA